jgi:hypothetical protein
MAREPLLRQIDHLVERTRFLEQMRGARHDLEALLTLQLGKRLSFSSNTPTSCPPTMSSVGARTWPSTRPAMSGRPPRETMAPISPWSRAAATSAAAAPVLAPK